MDSRIAIAAFLVMLTGSWVPCAAALDRQGAIAVAKRQVKGKCGPATLCTFNAKIDKNKWYVRVEFTSGDSPQDHPPSRPGGHAIFIIDQGGKVVGRIESD
jgi:hypothetical protein